MRSTRIHILLATSAILGGIAGTVLLATRQRAHDAVQMPVVGENSVAMQPGGQLPPPQDAAPALEARTYGESVIEEPANAPPPAPPQTKEQRRTLPKANEIPQTTAMPVISTGGGKGPLKDPVARVALFFVGADPDAEAYWYDAINDASLSAHERSDLIEDLNEDGLSDPKHPTEDDLPLIINRMLIIEEIASDAMDDVNADAFQEAYKDLVNLANLAMGGGEPVR